MKTELRIFKSFRLPAIFGPDYGFAAVLSILKMACKKYVALAAVAQWTEQWPADPTVASSIPGQGVCLG